MLNQTTSSNTTNMFLLLTNYTTIEHQIWTAIRRRNSRTQSGKGERGERTGWNEEAKTSCIAGSTAQRAEGAESGRFERQGWALEMLWEGCYANRLSIPRVAFWRLLSWSIRMTRKFVETWDVFSGSICILLSTCSWLLIKDEQTRGM